jgi:hypothetical protein
MSRMLVMMGMMDGKNKNEQRIKISDRLRRISRRSPFRLFGIHIILLYGLYTRV